MQDRPPAGRSVICPILRSRLVALGGDWLAAVGAGGAADDAVEGEDEVGEVLEAGCHSALVLVRMIRFWSALRFS